MDFFNGLIRWPEGFSDSGTGHKRGLDIVRNNPLLLPGIPGVIGRPGYAGTGSKSPAQALDSYFLQPCEENPALWKTTTT